MVFDENGTRIDRLISAVEAQTNAMARLVRLLEPTSQRSDKTAAPRMRRVALDKPIVVTPLIQAAVRRALAKSRG